MKKLFVFIALLVICINSYAQRTIKTKFYITSKVPQQNNGSGYNYHFVSGYNFDIDLYIFSSNGFEANPVLKNENKLPMYLSSSNDKLILSCKINKYNEIDVFLPRFGTYKLIAINNSFGRKMVANIGGPCIDCGETNVSIQLNEKIHRENLNFANYDYENALIYIFDDNNTKSDFKGDNISLPYNSLLSDVYNYIPERLIYSFSIPKNSSYKFYLPEGKFHFTAFDLASGNKVSMSLIIPYESPNYDEFKINLSQKMPLKWVLPSDSNGLKVNEPKSQSANTRVSKDEFEKNNGKTSLTLLNEEEYLIEDQYKLIDFSRIKEYTVYYSKEMDIKTFEIVVPENLKMQDLNIFVDYWDGISDSEYRLKLNNGRNIFKGYSIKLICQEDCYGKIYVKEK